MDISLETTGGNLALQRLLTWLSPAFPVGAFAYSAGLETAILSNLVTDQKSLGDWITGNLRFGSMHADAIILTQAHANDTNPSELASLADFSRALSPSAQRCQELELLGAAFVDAAKAWPAPVFDTLPSPCPYPVAVGAIAGAHNIALSSTLIAFLTAAVQTQISVAVRLVPLGQSEGLALLAKLEPLIAQCAAQAMDKTCEDIGTIAYAADIAAMQHETLNSRIFRS